MTAGRWRSSRGSQEPRGSKYGKECAMLRPIPVEARKSLVDRNTAGPWGPVGPCGSRLARASWIEINRRPFEIHSADCRGSQEPRGSKSITPTPVLRVSASRLARASWIEIFCPRRKVLGLRRGSQEPRGSK